MCQYGLFIHLLHPTAEVFIKMDYFISNLSKVDNNCTIVCTDKGEVHANSYLLSAQSPEFKELFRHSVDGKVNINDTVENVKIIVDYLQRCIKPEISITKYNRRNIKTIINMFVFYKKYMIHELIKLTLDKLYELAENVECAQYVYDLCVDNPYNELKQVAATALKFCAICIKSNLFMCTTCQNLTYVFVSPRDILTDQKQQKLLRCKKKIGNSKCEGLDFVVSKSPKMNLSHIRTKSCISILMLMNSSDFYSKDS